MAIDAFTEVSAERFQSLDAGYRERSVLLFPYRNYNPEFPPVSIGLWLSHAYRKKQIEAAHYIPDYDCRDALQKARAFCGNGAVWLGLLADVDSNRTVKITVPQFMLSDYGALAIDQEIPLKTELQERYNLQVEIQ